MLKQAIRLAGLLAYLALGGYGTGACAVAAAEHSLFTFAGAGYGLAAGIVAFACARQAYGLWADMGGK